MIELLESSRQLVTFETTGTAGHGASALTVITLPIQDTGYRIPGVGTPNNLLPNVANQLWRVRILAGALGSTAPTTTSLESAGLLAEADPSSFQVGKPVTFGGLTALLNGQFIATELLDLYGQDWIGSQAAKFFRLSVQLTVNNSGAADATISLAAAVEIQRYLFSANPLPNMQGFPNADWNA